MPYFVTRLRFTSQKSQSALRIHKELEKSTHLPLSWPEMAPGQVPAVKEDSVSWN